ncbi:MAG TPA: hypothetical protein VJ810_23320 [Blastocatellia bacterium]|nr:hypothetical protein [Blastocatellia bacterium]
MNFTEENSPDRNPNTADEVIEDRELKNLLGEWGAPDVTSTLDQRVITAYRRQFIRRPLWRRWLTGSISLPAPVAVAAALLLCATSYLAARKATSYPLAVPPNAPMVKIVEVPVPVIQEIKVTRVVYKNTDARKAKERPASTSLPPRIDLAGFRPVGEIKLIVIPGGNDEK